MKALTEQIYDELNAQVVRMLNHSLNQASRIVELETQLKDHSAQAFSIGETYANALSRIVELEAQIASRAATEAAKATGTAAQDSAPAELPIKTWQERAEESGADALTVDQCMKLAETEIAELRAAFSRPVVAILEGWEERLYAAMDANYELYESGPRDEDGHRQGMRNNDTQVGVEFAMNWFKKNILAAAPASPQPVAKVLADEDKWHSLTCDGTCSPPCKDAPLPPAFEVGSLSDDQLNYIARQYFAEEWAQNHLKNAIHDAFRAASTPTALTEKKE